MLPRNTAFIRQLLYDLKFRYGAKVIINRETENVDTDTGLRATTTSSLTIPRAVVLPETADRQFIARLSNIVANREFQYGGWFDAGKRLFLFEARDLGTWEPHDVDYLIFDTRRWEISSITKFEFNMGYIVEGKRIEGPKAFAVYAESARNRLLFSDEVIRQ